MSFILLLPDQPMRSYRTVELAIAKHLELGGELIELQFEEDKLRAKCLREYGPSPRRIKQGSGNAQGT